MVAVTYGVARVAKAETAADSSASAARAETAQPRKHWFRRVMDAMMEARLQQARREIRMYTQLMPHTYDERGNRKLKSEIGDLPFGGW